MNIREALPEDAGTIVDFNTRMAMETEGKQLDPEVLGSGVNAVFEDPKYGFYLVAEIDGRVAGSLLVTTEWSDWRNAAFWWIQSVFVEPEFRRRGVFRALYEEARERARRSPQVCGCRLYVERGNTGAQSAYARLGMTEVSYKMFEESFR
jgi:GNAT superfamily N-acetyltransferase